ncbi:hypothetical protein KUCAC02_013978, partial [Chaenocephalus aceratus]
AHLCPRDNRRSKETERVIQGERGRPWFASGNASSEGKVAFSEEEVVAELVDERQRAGSGRAKATQRPCSDRQPFPSFLSTPPSLAIYRDYNLL